MITFPAKFNNNTEKAGFTVLNPLTVPEIRTENSALTNLTSPKFAGSNDTSIFFNSLKGRSPQVIKMPIIKFDLKNWHLISPRLKEREKKILEARFGIGQKQISSLQDLGDELKLSKERVRQIQEAALKKCVKISEEIKFQKDGRGKIDPDVLTTAIVEGVSRRDAVVLAGSNGTSPQSLASSAQQVLSRPSVKSMLLTKLNEKKEQILEALTREKAGEATYLQLITSLGIIIDKEQLLKNEPTAIISQMPRMVIRGNEVSFEVPINNNVQNED